jgi:hypothetical protein
MSLCWCRARASGPIRGRRRDRIVRVGCQRGALCRVARARRLHISDYRLPAIIDVNVLDADILVSALQFDQRAWIAGARQGARVGDTYAGQAATAARPGLRELNSPIGLRR